MGLGVGGGRPRRRPVRLWGCATAPRCFCAGGLDGAAADARPACYSRSRCARGWPRMRRDDDPHRDTPGKTCRTRCTRPMSGLFVRTGVTAGGHRVCPPHFFFLPFFWCVCGPSVRRSVLPWCRVGRAVSPIVLVCTVRPAHLVILGSCCVIVPGPLCPFFLLACCLLHIIERRLPFPLLILLGSARCSCQWWGRAARQAGHRGRGPGAGHSAGRDGRDARL